ncbi:MAG: hypothetical protein M0008_12775 [Actinomycetota bacterium]|nr:hypothetical protein [Actinomycetota bacterium]
MIAVEHLDYRAIGMVQERDSLINHPLHHAHGIDELLDDLLKVAQAVHAYLVAAGFAIAGVAVSAVLVEGVRNLMAI